MSVTLFSDVFTLIDTSIINVIGGKTGNLMNALKPVFASGFSVYVIFITWGYMQGSSPEQTLWDFLKRIIAWGVIISFSVNIGSYTANVVPLVTGLGDGLSHYFVNGTGGGAVNSGLDSLADGILLGIWDTWDGASGVEQTLLAVCTILIVLVCVIPFFIISGAYILLAKVFCAVLAVVGPVFIALSLFPATKQFFSAWVSQVVSNGLLVLLLNITSTIFIEFIKVQYGTGLFDLARSLNLALVSGMFFVILLKLPDLASGLSNGMAMNGFGNAGRVAASAAKMGGLAKSALGSKKDSGGSMKNESAGKGK